MTSNTKTKTTNQRQEFGFIQKLKNSDEWKTNPTNGSYIRPNTYEMIIEPINVLGTTPGKSI